MLSAGTFSAQSVFAAPFWMERLTRCRLGGLTIGHYVRRASAFPCCGDFWLTRFRLLDSLRRHCSKDLARRQFGLLVFLRGVLSCLLY